jgi:hypothetical protein
MMKAAIMASGSLNMESSSQCSCYNEDLNGFRRMMSNFF